MNQFVYLDAATSRDGKEDGRIIRRTVLGNEAYLADIFKGWIGYAFIRPFIRLIVSHASQVWVPM